MKREQLLELEEYLDTAKAIAWDTCHKIYVLMDDQQVELMRGYGYDTLYTNEELDRDGMLEKVTQWYEDSCSLRFIDATETMPNGETEFDSIIGQFADEEEEN